MSANDGLACKNRLCHVNDNLCCSELHNLKRDLGEHQLIGGRVSNPLQIILVGLTLNPKILISKESCVAVLKPVLLILRLWHLSNAFCLFQVLDVTESSRER